IYIGTSNVVVPGNKTSFPAAYQSKSRLHYYSTLFNTVEINSSFYKTPLFTTYEKWTQEVPDDFRFSIKLTRDITHAKDLKGDWTHFEKFMRTAAGTGDKKGCLLVQFPGKITLDYFSRVEEILERLTDRAPEEQWPLAVEFRHPGWYVGETVELLDECGAALVLHDMPKSKIWEARTKAPFVYLRFHGEKGDYKESYSPSFLKEKATEIRGWQKKGKDVYVYFNNTIGEAFENARSLKAMLER
ncbi:MAG: DUF72 domain-containing protein, partial [Chitinophagaceae bacterium]